MPNDEFPLERPVLSKPSAPDAPPPGRWVGVIVAGFEVPHTHVHVIPMNSMGDISFANAAARVERADLDASAAALRNQLRELGRTEVSD